MNFFNIENELSPNCLKQFDDNKFIIWDVYCLEQFYSFIGKRLNELEKSRKIGVENIELEKEHNKMSTLLHEIHEKLEGVYHYQQEVEDSGSSFIFERHTDNDEKPIIFENLRQEDIRYTPPRLEFISNAVFEKNKNNYDDDNDDTKEAVNQANIIQNNITKYGGKKCNKKKKLSKKCKNKTVRKTKKQRNKRKTV
jgi:hypothetical protein